MMLHSIKQLFSLPSNRSASEEQEVTEEGKSIAETEHMPLFRRLPLQNMFYGLGCIILLFWILKIFKFIFIAITLSMFSCFMLLPIIRFIFKKTKIKKTKFMRTLISAMISLVYTIVVVLLSTVVVNNLLYFFGNLNIYEDQLNHIIGDIIARFNQVINELDREILPTKILEQRFNIREYILNSVSVNFYLNSANTFFTFISGALLVFIFIFFILNEAEKTTLKIKLILKKQEELYKSINAKKMYKSINKNINTISQKISKYLQLKVIVSLFTALLVWLLLNFCRVENSLTLAFFTFAFNFIPNVGSVAITLLITLMSIIQFYPLWNMPLIIGFSITAIQILIGNILDPKLQGDQLDLSPLLILVSLGFWGYLWGIIGMFLAVPMLEILRIIANNIQELQPIAIFISSGKKIRPQINAKLEDHPAETTT